MDSLRPLVFSILLALNDGEQHGYALMKLVNERLGRRAVLGPGTLYRTLKEMKDAGLIAHADAPADSDSRRHYYRITPKGRRAARAEAGRMAALVELARSGKLLKEDVGK